MEKASIIGERFKRYNVNKINILHLNNIITNYLRNFLFSNLELIEVIWRQMPSFLTSDLFKIKFYLFISLISCMKT